MVGVQVARHRSLLAESGPIRVAVLPTLVLRLVRARFAHVHGCESAALTRSGGRAARSVQGGLPQHRHLGPHNFDPFLGTVALLVIVSARWAQRPALHEGALHASCRLPTSPLSPHSAFVALL